MKPLLFLLLILLAFPLDAQDRRRALIAKVNADKAAGGAAGCDSVNDASLKAYWTCDEASGNLIDDKGANDLADNGTVTSAAGKVSTSRQFTAANSEFFTVADNADLSVGAVDFWIHAWVYFDGVSGFQALIDKGSANEYTLFAQDDGLAFTVNGGSATASKPASLSINTWYCIDAWWDNAAGSVNLTINAGSTATAAGAGAGDGVANFVIGSLGGSTWFLGGRLDEVFFSKRLPTADERTALYNSSNGCRPTL